MQHNCKNQSYRKKAINKIREWTFKNYKRNLKCHRMFMFSRKKKHDSVSSALTFSVVRSVSLSCFFCVKTMVKTAWDLLLVSFMLVAATVLEENTAENKIKTIAKNQFQTLLPWKGRCDRCWINCTESYKLYTLWVLHLLGWIESMGLLWAAEGDNIVRTPIRGVLRRIAMREIWALHATF